MIKKKYTTNEKFYGVICHSGTSKNNYPMLCGALGSLEEAKKLADEIKDCPSKHEIVLIPKLKLEYKKTRLTKSK